MEKQRASTTRKYYTQLINTIGQLLKEGRKRALQTVNQILMRTYWEVGRQIVEFEQQGGEKAEYGSKLLEQLAQDLKLRYGKGFSRRNVYLMRKFYLIYKNVQTVSAELSWSHYVILLSLEEGLERHFYERQCALEQWSFRELRRQINSALFQRIALSKDKQGVLALAKRGNEVQRPEDIIKDPYILEFLKIQERYSEKELEQKVIDNLQMFLLELGKGFAFIGRQHRISLGDKHFYIDLVFYHRILRCFVLIDLKIGGATPADIGQMNFYLNYFQEEEKRTGDNPPIGIVLSAHNNVEVRYALGGISNKLFVSKYKLYLPKKQELQQKVRELLEQKKDEQKKDKKQGKSVRLSY